MLKRIKTTRQRLVRTTQRDWRDWVRDAWWTVPVAVVALLACWAVLVERESQSGFKCKEDYVKVDGNTCQWAPKPKQATRLPEGWKAPAQTLE